MKKREITIKSNKLNTAIWGAFVEHYLRLQVERRDMNALALYVKSVFDNYQRISESSDRLQLSLNFLQEDKHQLLSIQHGVAREKFYEYHLAVFYTVLTSFSDQIILLVNAVYNLGLDERNATKDTVIFNRHVADSISTVFKKMDQLLNDGWRRNRNYFVHRGIVESADFIDIAENLNMLTDMKEILGKSVFNDYSEYFDLRHNHGKTLLIEKVAELKGIKEIVESEVISIAELLLEPFAENLNDLKGYHPDSVIDDGN